MRMQPLAITLTALNLALLVLTAGTAAFASRQEADQVLRGRALELVDDRGQVRSRIDVESSGEVVLRLFDQDGAIRVKLGAARDGSGLLLADETTEPGLHLIARRSPAGDRPNTTGITLRAGDRERVIRP